MFLINKKSYKALTISYVQVITVMIVSSALLGISTHSCLKLLCLLVVETSNMTQEMVIKQKHN